MAAGSTGVFHFIMIKPSHYDDAGYPILFRRSLIPSNTLAAINGLALDCVERQVLGPDVDVRLHTHDETNTRIEPEKIIRRIKNNGGHALIGFVGVQSNQFYRAVDLAKPFLDAGFKVVIGGFHVSGCLTMLPEMPVEIREAMELGISLFAGECENNRLDEILLDAYHNQLRSVYNHIDDLPAANNEPLPFLSRAALRRTINYYSSFDLGRGGLYQYSFCTIINAQGHKSRFRTPDDLERIVLENNAQGIHKFFIADDDFACNKDWEALFDRLIKLREAHKINLKLVIQVDTLCHKIPNFIEKACRAGVCRVFIRLKNINPGNPDNLLAAKKRQNKIAEHRYMLQKWRRHGATIHAGYILGFPSDTRKTILRDIAIIKKELPIDLLEFFFLTPLPGSEDHKNMRADGGWMDPDLNKYDHYHRVTRHPKMTDHEWQQVYHECWNLFYSWEHMETVLRRKSALPNVNLRTERDYLLAFSMMYFVEKLHPLEGGWFRLKYRKDRRPGLAHENPLVFYPKYWAESAWKLARFSYGAMRAWRIYRRVLRDAKTATHSDLAITLPESHDVENLSLFQNTTDGHAAMENKQHVDQLREQLRTRSAAESKLSLTVVHRQQKQPVTKKAAAC